ncbi:hypothetical protein FRB96_000316 [Tulasnella sp. 330]|nr:hypothetical protein FRB96_000316 [Tulasnella sp. 330]
MDPSLLSKHSSNPLQAPSDDPINSKYLQDLSGVLKREKNRGGRDPSSVHNNGVSEPEDLISTSDGVHGNDFGVGYDDEDMVNDDEAEEGMEELDEEELTLFEKDEQEQAQILAEIEDLENTVPTLKIDFKLIDRLGEGTFSSVYKAIDLEHHHKWHNKVWLGYHPETSSAHFQSVPYPTNSKVYVAIKRIYVTSSPSRIQNEIMLMEDCRGCRHVAQLITAFREKDQVVAIMPYHRNADFRNYFNTVPLSSIQQYLRCLLRALRDIHARQIIHRDIKPANFLFDPSTGQGVVVDFGLAQRAESVASTSCNHTAPTKDHPHGSLKSFSREHMQNMRMTLAEARKRSSGPSDKVGWFAEDTRLHIKANRAGTRGFRAPEVLFKCEDQTGALDIWSVGTILLSFLSCKFPIFNANDDVEALMEIATILGRKRIEKCAQLHNRTFTTNVPSIDHPGIPWSEMIERLNPSLRNGSPVPPRPTRSSSSSPHSSYNSYYNRGTDPLLPSAYDLLEKMLLPDMTKRITARDALFHPFLIETLPAASRSLDADEDMNTNTNMFDMSDGAADGGEGVLESREVDDPETGETIVARGDDLYVPHPVGEGICKKGHWVDEETGEPCCFEVVDDRTHSKEKERSKPKKDESKLSAKAKAKRDHDRRERIARERECSVYRLYVGPTGNLVDINQPDLSSEMRVVKVRLRRLEAGEGIAIGLDPCEYHRNGVVDASFYETHVQELQAEMEEDDGYADGDGRETDGMYSDEG